MMCSSRQRASPVAILNESAQCGVASLHSLAIVRAGTVFAQLGDSDNVVRFGVDEENHVVIAFNGGLTDQRYGSRRGT